MAITTDGNHVTGTLASGEKLAVCLRNGETQIIDGPADVDVWVMHRGVEVLDSAADVPDNIDPPTQAETVVALAELAGVEAVKAKVVANRELAAAPAPVE